jgi:hypothetical protein
LIVVRLLDGGPGIVWTGTGVRIAARLQNSLDALSKSVHFTTVEQLYELKMIGTVAVF